MVEWSEAQSLGFTYYTALVGDYALSTFGDNAGWVWTILEQDRVVFQGMEKSLSAAKLTAETVALRMQGMSGGAT